MRVQVYQPSPPPSQNFPSFPVSPAAPSSAAVAAAGSGGAPAAGAAATHLLTFTNRDLPGVVSRTAAVLAEANINIASMAVARQVGLWA